MADFKFNCPSCSQKIQATADWAGHQIQCPACQQTIEVPSPAPAPAQEARPAPKLSIGLAQHHKAPPPPVATFSQGTNPARHYSPTQAAAAAASNKSALVKRIVTIAICAVVLPVGGYYGFIAARNYQSKLNAEREKNTKDSDGGQLGHIASLYDALDATDPNKMGRFGDSGGSARGRAANAGAQTTSGAEDKLVAPAWTLEVDKVKLQRGRVNGSFAGTNFVAGSTSMDISGNMHVLAIREGTNAVFSNRELLVTLRLKPGETLPGQSWTIGPDARTNVPTVVKKSRPDPRYAPRQKSFANGYAMRLEFTQASDELVQGRIYVALPDEEKSVLAGQFNAPIRRPQPVAAGVAPNAPATRPPQQRF